MTPERSPALLSRTAHPRESTRFELGNQRGHAASAAAAAAVSDHTRELRLQEMGSALLWALRRKRRAELIPALAFSTQSGYREEAAVIPVKKLRMA